MRLFSDYHSHPQGHRLQPYSQALLQPWITAARERGLTDIALTDHDRYHRGVNFEEIARLREGNPDIKIRAGIELDNDPVHSTNGRRWVEENWDRLDFVLGSVHFLPNTILLLADGAESQKFLDEKLEAVRAMSPIDGKAAAYICENFVCQAPTTDPKKISEYLAKP